MVHGLGLVAMGLDQVVLVLVQEVSDQVALGLVVLVLVVTDLVALDQVDMGPALLGQGWVVLEPGQVVLDPAVLAQDQAAMVKGWGQESHPNQVQRSCILTLTTTFNHVLCCKRY